MSAPTDVITATPADTTQPPESFTEFRAWSKAQASGEQPPKEETPVPPTLPEAPAETPAKADEPETKTAKESGTKEEEEQVKGEETHGEKPEKVQKRIDRLTRDKYELKGRIAALEEQLAAGKPADKPAEKPAAAETTSADATAKPKPKFKDFLTEDKAYEDAQEEYTEALTDWKLAEREKTRAEAERKAEASRAAETRRSDWATKEAAIVEVYPDYQEAKESTKIFCNKDELGLFDDMLQESERGPEVLYHLMKHQEDLNRIVHLAPIPMARELGKIEAKLAPPEKPAPDTKSPAPAPTARATSAPKPITPVGGETAGGTPSLNDDKLAKDFSAWRKVRRAQEKDR